MSTATTRRVDLLGRMKLLQDVSREDDFASYTASTNLDNGFLLGAANLLVASISDSTAMWSCDALTTESNSIISGWRWKMEFREGVDGRWDF